MTLKEVVEDIRSGAEEVIREYDLNPPIAQKLK